MDFDLSSESDVIVIFLVESSLFILTLFCIYKDKFPKKAKPSSDGSKVAGTLEGTRGEQSMFSLYTVFGASLASFLVLIEIAEGIDGHKVALIVFNFLCLVYLFFFSSWFRNALFFRVKNKISKD